MIVLVEWLQENVIIAAQLLIQPGYPHMMELPSNAAADFIIPNVHNTHYSCCY